MITYSTVLRGNPRYPERPKKVFASAQRAQTITIKELAKQMKDNHGTYTEGEIDGIITDIATVIKQNLQEGNSVDLGPLGGFFITLDCEGADQTEEYDPEKHITGIRVNWRPSNEFQNLRKGVKFVENLSRRQTKEILKENQEKRQNGEAE